MKTATAGMIALLNGGGPFLLADLYTFTLAGGFVARYTSADLDLSVGGNLFSSRGPLFERTRVRQAVGTEVQTMDLHIAADSSMLLNGTPWLQALRLGALDGAYVKVERMVTDNWADTSRGALWMFGGNVSEITQIGRTTAALTVKSPLEQMNQVCPPDMVQPGCRYRLFEARCTLSKAAYGVNSTVAAGSTKSQINCGLSQAADWFTLGTITFTSGANTGISRTVKSYAPGVIGLSFPLLATPGIGDAFTAYPGCDKQQATCSGKFANLVNFGGEPYVPIPETVL